MLFDVRLPRAGRCLIAVAAATIAVSVFVASAGAAQPWTCDCKDGPRRFLASTRHCENLLHIPKRQSCTKAQWRKVYGPACRKEGCRLPAYLR